MTYSKHKEKKIDAVIQLLQYFFFKRLFNNNQLLQIPHLQFVRSKLLPTKQFCSLWKKYHNIKTERFKRHHQLQTVLWRDHTVSSDGWRNGCSSTLRKTSQSVREQQQKQPLYEGNAARWYLFSTTATCRKVCLALWLFVDHHCWTSLSLSSDGSVQARQLHVSATWL